MSEILLPTTVPVPTTSGLRAGPLFTFSTFSTVPGGRTFYIDPLVATGYEYRIGDGDPNFQSVTIATSAGDDRYDVYIWDGTDWVPIRLDLGLNEEFDFTTLVSGGVDRFQIRGIEVDAGLNPFEVTAFVTGLSLVSDGMFTGTMQALVAEVAGVPEPATLLLIAVSLAALGYSRCKRPLEDRAGPS